MPRLQWVDRDGETMTLGSLPVLVGKDPSCLIRPRHLTCARRHARFALFEGSYVVQALSEEHPVMVNGNEVSSHLLEDRDEVQCGQLKITFWSE